MIDFDSDFEYVNSLTNPIQRVEEEDINDQYDRCESLLSDMESYGTRSGLSTPFTNPVKSTNKFVGMETIKRQMDNLTEMVNDLQIQMECRDKVPVIPDIPSEQPMSPIYGQPVSTISSESDLNIQTTTGDDEDEFRNEPIMNQRSNKRSKNKIRLRWRSFYTAHQVKIKFVNL